MIDIISSSIRVGRILRENKQLKLMYDFFEYISNDKSDPIAFDYKKLLTSKFIQYGFYAFDAVDKIIEQNLDSDNRIASNLSKNIKTFVSKYKDYQTLLHKSIECGDILNDYVTQLLRQIDEFPQIKLDSVSLKLQQSSNELSTAILRSGVFCWHNDPEKITFLKKNLSLASDYEKKTASYEHLHPYNRNNLKIINSLNKSEQKIAYYTENIRFVQFLVRNGIIQGFFFELFDIPSSRITRIKEIHTNQSIHPVIIKTDSIYPSDHLIFFRYTMDNKVSYLLTKRMRLQLFDNEIKSTLYGYSYPTNEYSLLKID